MESYNSHHSNCSSRIMQYFISFLYLIILSLASVFSSRSCALDLSSLGSLSVQAAIEQLGQELQATMESARQAGRAITIEAGMQTNYALINFSAIYDREKDKTINDLGELSRAQLGRIVNLINDLKNEKAISLEDFSKQTQQIVNSLPFHNKEPQLRGIFPSFIVPDKIARQHLLEFRGNFEHAARKNFKPSLTVKGQKATLLGNDTQKLIFSLPSKAYTDSLEHSPSQFGFIKGELIVPYAEPKLIGMFSTRRENHYNIILERLPGIPGIITVDRDTIQSVVEMGTAELQNAELRSDRHGGNRDHNDVPFELKPTPGWEIIPTTSEFIVSSGGGPWSKQLVSDHAGGVIYNVTTIYHRFGSCGRVNFNIKARQQRTIQKEEKRTAIYNDNDQLELGWGEQRSLPLQHIKAWKIKFTTFDGKYYETGKSGNLGGILYVSEGQSLDIKATEAAHFKY